MDVVQEQSALRLLNERIELFYGEQAEMALTDWMQIRCECGRPACDSVLRVMRGEYEAARLDGRFFLVSPGHGVDGVETPVASSDRYDLVETSGEAAARAAVLSPRRCERRV
jgi:hypothetical protein